MVYAAVRARVRQLIADGFLPKALPRQTWGGPAAGDRICSACGELIGTGAPEIEAECADGVRRCYHAACSLVVESVRGTTV